jgi:5-methyltetrahydropteroyltriglutamate--homocysteine methyltransferase
MTRILCQDNGQEGVVVATSKLSLGSVRAEQVGSLLRPQALLEARFARQSGELSDAALAKLEDEAILAALRGQRVTGQQVFVDGELRRTGFMTGFPDSVEGFVLDAYTPIAWKGGTGNEGPSPNTQLVIGHRLKSKLRIAKNEADFLKQHAPGPFKITLPSPVVFAAIFWRRGVSQGAYPTPGDFLTDAASILASEAQALGSEGTPYIQLDAPVYTHWADESLTAKYQLAGFDMDRFLSEAIAAENTILDAAAPATTGVHLCRGNSMGRWLAEGGYDKIAERLFNELRCDRLLLEYDSPRAGDFAPLRFVPKNKIVVLGLITTKHGKLETADEIVRRIDEAARYLPVEQLVLSPQCGFASSGRGNPLTEDQQWRKLELVSAVAETVWKH